MYLEKTDFDLEGIGSEHQTLCGTEGYITPEIIQGKFTGFHSWYLHLGSKLNPKELNKALKSFKCQTFGLVCDCGDRKLLLVNLVALRT